MGRGRSGVGGGNSSRASIPSVRLSTAKKTEITQGIVNHTSAQNDKADASYQSTISREKNILDNYDVYVRMGRIRDKTDEWWQYHQETYDTLIAQYDYFKRERERLKK